MKSLLSFIKESHGVVTGEHSWSAACLSMAKLITADMSLYESSPYIFHDPTNYEGWRFLYLGGMDRDLPPWCGDVTIGVYIPNRSTVLSDCAAFLSKKSFMAKDQLCVVIMVAQKYVKASIEELSVILEHEMSHAFDQWMQMSHGGTVLKNKKSLRGSYLSNNYKDTTFVCFWKYKDMITVNSLIDLFNKYTYFTDSSEIKAYAREFKIALDRHAIADWDDFKTNDKLATSMGFSPFIWYESYLGMLDCYKEKFTDADLEILFYDADRWLKDVLGKTFGYADPWSRFEHIIKYMGEYFNEHVIKEYRRIYKSFGYPIPNIPKYLQ